MNNYWQQTLQTLTNEAIKAGKDVITFVQAQAPDLCRELVLRTIIINSFSIIFMVFLMLIILWRIKANKKKMSIYRKEGCSWKADDLEGANILIGILSIIPTGLIIYNIYRITIAILTPKLLIIEMLKNYLTT